MTMNAIAMNIGCSNRVIQYLRQCFQARGLMEDRPCSGCPHVMMRGQDLYILTILRHNHFQIATDTAANTHGTHNKHISIQPVRHCFHKGELTAHCLYVGCILNAQRYQDEILARHVILKFKIMPISLFFSMIMPQAIQLGTLNFLRANNITFINDWPAKSPDLNRI